MRFTYRSGQRPLDSYTIKRGVGQGGFGEVYFAVSDGGKEVALKLLRGHSDIELRGVANCLNLKHPNLVHIYDLKTDGHGDHWLIMEYVLGESMAQVLDRHPNGLPVPLAVDWFQCLARAVGYLHDHGVVHRDLKPANIFVETGNLKVGDYGLCKAMSGSGQRQTQTVGTVHYMAPEVSTGNYNKAIDIYACGVMLHEMLTGKLPFDGETDGEILMKHLTATPDLSMLSPSFRPVVERALDKNPLKRFATLAEMARAVEQAHTPSVVAPPPVAKPAPPPAEPTVTAPALKAPALPVAVAVPALPIARPVIAAKAVAPAVTGAVRDRLSDLVGGMLKAPLIAAVGAFACGFFSDWQWDWMGKTFLITVAATWAVLLGTAGAGYRAPDRWGRRFRMAALGLAVGAVAYWLGGGQLPDVHPDPENRKPADMFIFSTVQWPATAASTFGAMAAYFACAMGACRWWRMTARDRKDKWGMFPVIAAGFWGGVFGFFQPWAYENNYEPMWLAFGVAPMVLTAAAVQWVSPWVAPPPPTARRLRWKAA